MENGEIAHLFPTMFSVQSVSSNPLIAMFYLSAASLNLGQSQNGVLGNGLRLVQIESICR